MSKNYRIVFLCMYLMISAFILLFVKSDIFGEKITLENVKFWHKALWCIAFVFLGFFLLGIKICINDIKDKHVKPDPAVFAAEILLHNPNFDTARIQAEVVAYNLKRISEEKEETRNTKINLRYFIYYPLMLIVLALLATTISIHQFKLNKLPYFEASALLSFFMGYFVDSLPNLIEKLGSKIGGKE